MMNPRVLAVLCCTRDGGKLCLTGDELICESGHAVPIDRGVPVFSQQPRREDTPSNMDRLDDSKWHGAVDRFVDDWIVNTNGNLYWRVRGRLTRYPIPAWPGPTEGNNRKLVDIGCSWGRWSIAAARAGFQATGVDVHLDALWAANRVSSALKVAADFVCCDAEELPFRPESIDFVFSYSVLQHLEKKKVMRVLKGAARILRAGGACLIQLPNAFGLISVWRQSQRKFAEPAPDTFEMRYWKHAEIGATFREAGFENIRIRADGFLLQNTQREDLDLLSITGKAAVRFSSAARRMSQAVPPLVRLADSLWVEARRK